VHLLADLEIRFAKDLRQLQVPLCKQIQQHLAALAMVARSMMALSALDRFGDPPRCC
jgi:hypothetical protein